MRLPEKITTTGLQLLARLGIPKFQYELARRYYVGGSLPRDAGSTLKWCEPAAIRGYAPAEVLMGQLHVNGFGVACDQYEIVKWFQRAANHGDASGIHQLAWCYEQGIGVLASPQHAFRLWLNAASLGLPNSQLAVAGCFFRGAGTARNVLKAQLWCRQAIKNGAESRANALLNKIEADLRAPLAFGE